MIVSAICHQFKILGNQMGKLMKLGKRVFYFTSIIRI